jgi:hypothetical protein
MGRVFAIFASPPSSGLSRPFDPLLPVASPTTGVGNIFVNECRPSGTPRCAPAHWLSSARGVGIMPDDEDPLPAVPRADAASRKYKRLDRVACGFQVSAHVIECHADEASNVLTTDPSGPDLLNNAQHLRPEVAVIRRASLLAGHAEGLAGESSGEEINMITRPSVSVCTLPFR